MLSLIPWWMKAAAIAVVLVSAFGAGVWTRDAFCDAAAAKQALAAQQKIAEDLRQQITAYNNASVLDAQRAAADQQEIIRLEGVARELETRISDGACLSGSDVDELRSLWPDSAR